jgi:hypothetical protein
MNHRFELETKVEWHAPWAAKLNFVRECYCWGAVRIPKRAILVAVVRAGNKSARVYFLLPGDGIGKPKSGFGRAVFPSIHPGCSCPAPREKHVSLSTRRELSLAFGFTPHPFVRLCLFTRLCAQTSRTWLFSCRERLRCHTGGLVSQWHRVISTACRLLRWE